jgi:DNA repair protein RecN (Recombination protein N)
MLAELAIRNFAIIESVDMSFGEGLNVLTGETGAGKSILIDALGAVLGDRVSTDMVRTGARSASIDATFDLNRVPDGAAVHELLAGLEIEVEDGALILSRDIQSSGRSSARVNGRPATASVLNQIGSLMVDIHGQSDHLSLLRPAAQRELLDHYAQTTALREEFAAKLSQLRQVEEALRAARSGARERMQRLDLLQYQIDEIGQADLRPGEEEELLQERNRLANAERLSVDAASVYQALSGGDDDEVAAAALPVLRQATKLLDEIVGLDPQAEPLRERLNELLFSLEDLSTEVRTYRDEVEADPARLEVVEERLALLRQLMRKYGADIEEILAHAKAAQEELARLTGSEVDAEALTERREVLAGEAGELAGELSRRRRAAAGDLAPEVEQAIAELKMGASEFAVELEWHEDPEGLTVRGEDGASVRVAADATGIDRVTFQIATNVGEGLKPLSRIASGGETARIMLALKSILSDADRTPTLVFDEIDVGVGGRSGQVVGEKLWKLTTSHQVIVITHLPQIAAFADEHFRIAKAEREERVISIIERLESADRDHELAAMIDGQPVTASALQSASEMRQRAESSKGLKVSLR